MERTAASQAAFESSILFTRSKKTSTKIPCCQIAPVFMQCSTVSSWIWAAIFSTARVVYIFHGDL